MKTSHFDIISDTRNGKLTARWLENGPGLKILFPIENGDFPLLGGILVGRNSFVRSNFTYFFFWVGHGEPPNLRKGTVLESVSMEKKTASRQNQPPGNSKMYGAWYHINL